MKKGNAKHQLTVFIVDDEPGSLAVLANDLRQIPEIKEVHTFTSYSEATFPLIDLQPDVVFLDVEVPGKSGLEFLRSVRPRLSFSFHAVFYTGFSQYMLDAIRSSAFDFLLKPYKPEELRAIIDRLLDSNGEAHSQSTNVYCDRPTNKLALQTISELVLVTVEEILMLQYDRVSRAWVLTLTDTSTHRLHASITAASYSRCRQNSFESVLIA